MASAFAVRAIRADQPIVEGYVGRQIPTAMVARNLERGSGFLWPSLDTGPFPNLFLVEPPIYAECAVALRRLTGLALEPCGRLVSALGIVLAAWGLFVLVRRREGEAVALLAAAAFVCFPVTIRYGRAFQPDALMLGTLLAGMAACDLWAAGGKKAWLVAGGALVATGLALKITSAYVLVPLALVILKPRCGATRSILAGLALVPAFLWYAYAVNQIQRGGTSTALAENAAVWQHVLVPSAFFSRAWYETVGRVVCIRAFTPLGFLLGLAGFVRLFSHDGLWRVWASSAALALAVLAGKLHHEYYWLALAPVAAVGMGRALVDLARAGTQGRLAAAALGAGFLALCAYQSRSAWQTPVEWARLREAAAEVQARVPENVLLVAPEALLYYADRRGFRLELDPTNVARAIRELGLSESSTRPRGDRPTDLVWTQAVLAGASYIADHDWPGAGPRRRALHDRVRQDRAHWPLALDRPGVVLIAGPYIRQAHQEPLREDAPDEPSRRPQDAER